MNLQKLIGAPSIPRDQGAAGEPLPPLGKAVGDAGRRTGMPTMMTALEMTKLIPKVNAGRPRGLFPGHTDTMHLLDRLAKKGIELLSAPLDGRCEGVDGGVQKKEKRKKANGRQIKAAVAGPRAMPGPWRLGPKKRPAGRPPASPLDAQTLTHTHTYRPRRPCNYLSIC